MPSVYFKQLDVVRFFAAMMIIFLHAFDAWSGWFGALSLFEKPSTPLQGLANKWLDQWVHGLNLGVDIFFLMSGFLITYLLLEEKKQTQTIHLSKFYIRRSLRIWPVYYLVVASSPLLVQWLQTETPNFLANALFVGNFHTMKIQTWEFPFSHFWSICIEEHFYLFWPLIVYWIPRSKLLATICFLILFSIGYRLYVMQTIDLSWFNLFAHTFSRMDVLLIGALVAYYYSHQPIVFNLTWPIRISLWVLLMLGMAIEPMVLWDTFFLAAFKKYFYIGIVGLIMGDYVFNPKVLSGSTVLQYLGKISYGIYMYGNIILVVILKKGMWLLPWHQFGVFLVLVLAATLAIAVVSYECIERPILRYAQRFKTIPTSSIYATNKTI